MAAKPEPRFMTHTPASRPKFNDPGQRRDVTPIPSCVLKDQYSDPIAAGAAPRSVTPKRQAMWRNFGGSQAAMATGHAGMAFGSGPRAVVETVYDKEAAVNATPRHLRRSGTPQPQSSSGSARVADLVPRPTAPDAGAAGAERSGSAGQAPMARATQMTIDPNRRGGGAADISTASSSGGGRSFSPGGGGLHSAARAATREMSKNRLLSHNQLTYSTVAVASGAGDQSTAHQPHMTPHWTTDRNATHVVPVEKNSSTLGGRADSVLRSAPFPHHKNMVLPCEDESAPVERAKLWMDRPLRDGQRSAPTKRHYNIPGFARESNEPGVAETVLKNASGNKDDPNTRTRPIKRKVAVPTHLAGGGCEITEPVEAPRPLCKPLVERVFRPPFNETDRREGAPPQEVPRAARVLGRRHMTPPPPSKYGNSPRSSSNSAMDTDVLPCWSQQAQQPRTGRQFHPNSYATSADFPQTDSVPDAREMAALRARQQQQAQHPQRTTVRCGAPAFVPGNGGSAPVAAHPMAAAAVVASATPLRRFSPQRMRSTPTDSDIFGARAQRQPWQPQPNPAEQPRYLSPAPGAIDVKRCKGTGQFSPMRVMPTYRF